MRSRQVSNLPASYWFAKQIQRNQCLVSAFMITAETEEDDVFESARVILNVL